MASSNCRKPTFLSAENLHFFLPKTYIFKLPLTLVLFLSGCSKSAHSVDKVIVYDSHHNHVTTIKNQQSLKSFSDLLGKAGAKTSNTHGKITRDAKVSYYYVMKQAKPKVTLHMYTYSNSHYSRLKGLPVLGTVDYKLSNSEYNTLNKPQNLNR